MKAYSFLASLCLLLSLNSNAQNWTPVPGKIASPWVAAINPAHPLPEYPRPLLVRENNWKNLNGLWDYAITNKDEITIPKKWDGKILVPFAIESSLSGVGKTVGEDHLLWYHTTIDVANLKNTILLHFGAVDWRTEIYLNGTKVGSHEGGFDSFTIDITPHLKKGGKQELVLSVWDPTDKGYQPRGKQVVKPNGIWYTPVTGIWQTVWIESVAQTHIANTKQTPDIDSKSLNITTEVKHAKADDKLKITAFDGQTKVAEVETSPNQEAKLHLKEQKLWSPSNPFLYNLTVELMRGGKVIDKIQSYFAMRKSSMGKDKDGIMRMLLNDEFVFQYGPLDQGWWPDGLYTAPTDEALKFDIIKTKEMGFNMIRKHIKVEPARWYYECDKQGLLVWQDMPSGDLGNKWEMRVGDYGGTDKDRTPESEASYKKEWNSIMDMLHNYPSIVVWVPFNEAWGQFKTKEITEWTKQKDPSRLVNSASGGNFEITGDIVDLHNYPEPKMPRPDIFGKTQAIVLGEFGGLGLPVVDHTWQNTNNWGYQTFKNADELFAKYASFMDRLEHLITKGLSAAVYTQTTDVEIETNGLMTYDRKVIKVPAEKLKSVTTKLYNKALVKL
ncbi:glycoside hydrolase family 2 protein [Pedobacter insulae]|uniref:Glycosyl hydrolases family 2, TIM barrel domain n=1 Tax=Pedobacter insulae TaxID=414048 RepID=A0A1I2UFN2_9SPHI|nr:glycoside hydrolase family 2 TIM barrel-domain containing protein [Pedobacter insulae]SFG74457.1 Glycosyl hydrolases family 2, TIM barrel domain [Pedobacter insulae]